jgi:GDP-L-fucose synthase
VLSVYPTLEPDRVHVVKNGVDTDVWYPAAPEPGASVLAELGVDPSRPMVAFVGRITRQKGVPHLIAAAHQSGVNRLLFLGSSCIYPRDAENPIPESALLTGPLERTNEWYAIAKIAGIKLCQAYHRQYGRDYISAMPCNLYGPGDYFHPERSHVIPALLQRFHNAARDGLAEVTCWGSGTPRREFLHVDDLADACAFLLARYSGENHLNVGTGSDITIRELAETIASVTGFRGKIRWDTDKPDGTMLKRMDVSAIARLGWQPRIGFSDGLASTYSWFREQPALRQ